jgi:transcriptional regulator with XRE-family HTH domain
VGRSPRANQALAAAAGVSPGCLTEIETGRKPGSFDALAKIIKALAISLDDIAAWRDKG